jgi:antitoxin component YwqK of YwqJK toxin-antitoxin module
MKKITFIIILFSLLSCSETKSPISNNGPIPLQKADTNSYTGSLIEYYTEGTSKKFIEVYKEGVKNGKYKSWYKSGQLKVTGNYSHNKRIGVWKWFTEKGELEYLFEYKT